MQSIETQKYWLSGGGQGEAAAMDKINFHEKWRANLIGLFQPGWNFTSWHSEPELCKYVNTHMEYFIALSSLSVVRGEPKLNDLLSCHDIQHLGLFQTPAGLYGIDGNICEGKFCLFVTSQVLRTCDHPEVSKNVNCEIMPFGRTHQTSSLLYGGFCCLQGEKAQIWVSGRTTWQKCDWMFDLQCRPRLVNKSLSCWLMWSVVILI